MSRSKKKIESNIFFTYIHPEMNLSYYHAFSGKTFQAQLLTLSVETRTARVRLYDLQGNMVTGNYDISADQFFEQMMIVPK